MPCQQFAIASARYTSGVQYMDAEPGAGAQPVQWQLVTIRYRGLLANRTAAAGQPVCFAKVRPQNRFWDCLPAPELPYGKVVGVAPWARRAC